MDAQIELAIASSSGDYHAAVAALDAGADPNWIDHSNGNCPVLNACKMGHSHIVHLLCSRGLNPNTQFSWRSAVDKSRHKNKTALMFARQADVVDALVEAGADPNQTDDDGTTPLMIACHTGKLDLVKTLLKCGAIVTSKNNMGATAADIVYHRNRKLAVLRRPENADVLDSKLIELCEIAALFDEHAGGQQTHAAEPAVGPALKSKHLAPAR